MGGVEGTCAKAATVAGGVEESGADALGADVQAEEEGGRRARQAVALLVTEF